MLVSFTWGLAFKFKLIYLIKNGRDERYLIKLYSFFKWNTYLTTLYKYRHIFLSFLLSLWNLMNVESKFSYWNGDENVK